MTPDALEAAAARPGGASSDFDLNPDVILPGRRMLRDAAVLVPFVDTPTGLRLLLTKRVLAVAPPSRADRLSRRQGSSRARRRRSPPCARPSRRSACRAAAARVLGRLPPHETVTGFTVTPVLAHVAAFDPVPEPGEVEEVFTVPAAHVLDPAQLRRRTAALARRMARYYAVPHGPVLHLGRDGADPAGPCRPGRAGPCGAGDRDGTGPHADRG